MPRNESHKETWYQIDQLREETWSMWEILPYDHLSPDGRVRVGARYRAIRLAKLAYQNHRLPVRVTHVEQIWKAER